MGLPVVTVASGGLPIVESTVGGTPVTEAANGRGVAVTKVAALGLPVVFETIGVAVPVTYATWDAATGVNVTFSNGNLTAAHNTTTTNSGARVVNASAKTTGKYYFEIKVDVLAGTDPNAVGVAQTDATLANVISGGTLCTVAYCNNGNIYSNGVSTGKTLGALPTGSVIGVAVDLTARKAWLRKGAAGNWNGDDAAMAVGVVMGPTTAVAPIIGFASGASANTDVVTANFGASAFVGAVPAGFMSGWPA